MDQRSSQKWLFLCWLVNTLHKIRHFFCWKTWPLNQQLWTFHSPSEHCNKKHELWIWTLTDLSSWFNRYKQKGFSYIYLPSDVMLCQGVFVSHLLSCWETWANHLKPLTVTFLIHKIGITVSTHCHKGNVYNI